MKIHKSVSEDCFSKLSLDMKAGVDLMGNSNFIAISLSLLINAIGHAVG